MGLILDSSILIAAERKGHSVLQALGHVLSAAGNQEAALASVGLVELAHGIYRADTAERRERRRAFINELLDDVPVYPLTGKVAMLAGKIDGEQQAQGVKIHFQDLLIGATALDLGYAVVTGNLRHFEMIPGLTVVAL
jgi:predicted nucleic acid-binding protein